MTPDETLRVLGTLMEAVGDKTDRTINKEFDATACVTHTAKVFSTLDSLNADAANAVRAKLAEEPECPLCGEKLLDDVTSGKKNSCPEHGCVPDEVLNDSFAMGNEPLYDMLTVTTVECWGTEVRIESEYGYKWSAYYDTELVNGKNQLKWYWENYFVPGKGEVQPPFGRGTALGMIEKLLLGAGDWSGEDPRTYEPDPMGSLSQYE